MPVERLVITLFGWFADLILDIFTLDLPEGLFVFTSLLFVRLGKIWIFGILEILLESLLCVVDGPGGQVLSSYFYYLFRD